MDLLFFELFFSAIGRIFMFFKYRDDKKRKKVLEEKYDGRYSAVGLVITLNLIAGIGAISMICAVIFVIYVIFTK